MKKVNQLFQINGQKFSNSVTVVQQNDSTLVDLKRRREVYSEGIGLIYQEKINVSYCNSADCLGKGKIDFGTKHILKFKFTIFSILTITSTSTENIYPNFCFLKIFANLIHLLGYY